ncbi:bile acid-CoA:amino acid N-acyltransferase-like isoform X2 [Oncorhynchus mykiss]|uniref:bile acid-CoA:amino acid N-acyltransferase-like isoform X2 n=1 Tax=Oncorhynchus mykiss TaxID=8022 RepID=UPI0018789D28|nr:bile acid-CoA:amino acid N-acyltransferase-like isoform X2 [Oncorhynchus mykiss]
MSIPPSLPICGCFCLVFFYRCLSTMVGTYPLLSVQPMRGLVDEKIQVVVRNLPPALSVTLHSLHRSEDNDFWEAFGHYTSNDQGMVTVAKDASLGGTYEGAEPMGLLWSMQPVPGSRTGLSGHMTEGFSKQSPLATVVTERWYMAPGVCRIHIREHGVRGTLFLPPGPGPFPGVLDMWGGGGGLVEYRSCLLASHGFVSMALEYLSHDKNRTSDIESTTYFEKAFRIVQEHPLVMKDRVALFGLSLGASVALNLAAYSKDISPKCCVCISGSHVHRVNQAFSKVFRKMNKDGYKTRFDEEGRVVWRDFILPIPTDLGEKVDMGRIKCPLMLVVGEDDQNLATVESAKDMTQMMRAAGNEHLLTILQYPDAGHLIEMPYTPHFRASSFIVQQTGQKVMVLWGGYTKPHADAQEDFWEKSLSFLRQHLYPSPDSVPKAKL